jgi:hypothetical protein
MVKLTEGTVVAYGSDIDTLVGTPVMRVIPALLLQAAEATPETDRRMAKAVIRSKRDVVVIEYQASCRFGIKAPVKQMGRTQSALLIELKRPAGRYCLPRRRTLRPLISAFSAISGIAAR